MNLRFLFFSILPTINLVANDNQFFETNIRPVLSEKCYECHSSKAAKIKGGLRLDHIELILQGGDSGPAIIQGKPDDSLIVQAIRYDDLDFHMPPKEKLPKKVVQDFKKWISEVADWPDEQVPTLLSSKKRKSFNLEKRKNSHWCWQPISDPSIPQEVALKQNQIDYFIGKRLSEKGLLPALATDRRTWLRRVTFDLTGFPPTLEEIGHFISDESENAHLTVVDRLLSSNHFGEKWARHWMDLVRYAETCGHEFDYPLEHPHEYRDYLIRAFNLDVPYDQFLREHVAGDLIKEPRKHPSEKFNESIIGTGFWYFHEAVHAPTDPKVDNADRMENQLDVFGKTFLGLTIGCARCHDHKFDAISEKDYYSMAAFMQGSNRQEYPLDAGGAREGIANEIEALCQSAFSSLSVNQDNFQLTDLPSRYWKGALQLNNLNPDKPVPPFSLVENYARANSLNAKTLRSWCMHFNQLNNLQLLSQGIKSAQNSHIRLVNGEKSFIQKSQSFANFTSSEIPKGWKITGEAFKPRGNQLISFDGSTLFPDRNVLSSHVLGNRRVGNLRSPHFKI